MKREYGKNGLGKPGRYWLIAGASIFLLSTLVPAVGENALHIVRGKAISSGAALEILPLLLGLVACAGGFVGILCVSTGFLLSKSEGEAVPATDAWGGSISSTGPLSAPAIVVIILLTVAFLVAQVCVSDRSLTFDEILQVEADVTSPWLQALNPRSWINHISGTLLARIGYGLLGSSERALRMPAVLVGTAAFAALGLWTAQRTGSLFPAALLMITLGGNGLVLEMTTQIRGYAPMLWFGAITVVLGTSMMSAQASREGRKSSLLPAAGLAIVSTLLGLSHLFGLFYLSAFTVLAHGNVWLMGAKRRRAVSAAAALSLGTAVSLLVSIRAFPWLFYYQRKDLGFDDACRRVLEELSVLFLGRGDQGLAACLLLVATTASGVVVWRKCSELRIVALIATLPLGILVGAGLFGSPTFFFGRFMLLGLLLALQSLALALGMLVAPSAWSSLRGAVIFGLLLGFAGIGLAPGFIQQFADRRGYREAASELRLMASRIPGSRGASIVVAGDWASQTLVRYYSDPGMVASDSRAALILAGKVNPEGYVVAFVGQTPRTFGKSENRVDLRPADWKVHIPGPRGGSPLTILGFGPR